MLSASSSSSSNTGGDEFTVIMTGNGTTTVLPGSAGRERVLRIHGFPGLSIGNNNYAVVQEKVEESFTKPEPHRHHHRGSSPKHVSPVRKPQERKLQTPVSREDMHLVASYVGPRWKRLGMTLGQSRGALECIEYDYRVEGAYEMAWQTLLKWQRSLGPEATVEKLVYALEACGLGHIASQLMFS